MVIVYDYIPGDPKSSHSIFVKDYKDGVFHCINSHGDKDQEPTISKERVIRLYYVAVCTAPEDLRNYPKPSDERKRNEEVRSGPNSTLSWEDLTDFEREFLEKITRVSNKENETVDLKKALTGNGLVPSIVRKLAFYVVRQLRPILREEFPSESLETFDTSEKIRSNIKDFLKFGASHVKRDRVFITGHQGSGKTSLIQSIRLF